MGARNIHRLLVEALKAGYPLDLGSSDALKFLPDQDDTGAVHFGDGTTDMDVKMFLGSTSNYALFDVGNARLQLEAIDLLLGDDDLIILGDGSDVQLTWNGTYLTAGPASGLWAGCPSPLDPNFHSHAYMFFDDFFTFDSTATVGGWAVTEDDAADTQALDTTQVGGVLLLTQKATTDNDGAQIEAATEAFKLAAGKHLWFEARVKTAAGATEVDMYAGLAASEDLTGVADNLPGDGVMFTKTDGATTLKFTASKNGTDTGQNANVGTWTTGWHKIGFYVNGVTSITPYFDGVAGTAITATICDDEVLRPIFGVRNGDATTTQTLAIDYVKVVQLR